MTHPTVPVRADAITENHLPVIHGHPVDLMNVADLRKWGEREVIELSWVPVGAPLDAPIQTSEHVPGELMSCVRRADWNRS